MIPTHFVPNSSILLVGDFASEMDIVSNTPFSRQIELDKMLGEVGLSRARVSMGLAHPDRAPGGRVEGLIAGRKMDITPKHILFQGKHVLPSVVAGIEQLRLDILRLKPNVVCAMGNLALWALTGEWGVTNWRSSIMESTLIPGLKVIPTLSPTVIQKQWSQRPLIVHDLKRVVRESKTPVISRPNYSFVTRPSYGQALETLNFLIDKALLASRATGDSLKMGVDIETRAGHIACIAFAWTPTDSICIPLMCQHSAEGYWTLGEEAELVQLMCKLLSITTVIGQNWNYDAQYIYRHWHFLCPSVIDTMILQHSCFSNLPKNLAFLSSMYLDDHLYWKDDRTNWTTGPKGEGEDKYWIYNCTDAVRTLAIETVLQVVVDKMGLRAVNEFQQQLAPIVLNTMIKGIRVDLKGREAFSEELQREIAIREAWILEVLEQPLNIRSPKQMADFFYRQMGQKEIKHRSGAGYSVTCNDEALRTIAAREPILHPLIKRISELRSLGVFHSTFITAPLDIDRRLRTSFNVCGTETYRFSSAKNAFGTGLNMQNIPKGGEVEDDGLDLPNVRKIFIPDPGHTFFDIDLDSADLRIVTWESDCKWMKENFKAGRKPYIEVMKEYYRNPSMTKHSHPREYAMFKSLCHGTNYLGTADGIAPRIGLNVLETERIQKWYFGLCPEIKKWQDDIKRQVSGRRYVENAFGYRNYFFDKIEGTIFNQAVAWIPQSTVACLINRAYVNIDRNLKEVEILLQVHDSLAGQFDSLHGDWALRRIVEEANIAIPYPEPLVIPVGIVSSSNSWGDCG